MSTQLWEVGLQQEGSLLRPVVGVTLGWAVSGCHRCTGRRIQKLMEESESLLFSASAGKGEGFVEVMGVGRGGRGWGIQGVKTEIVSEAGLPSRSCCKEW